MCVIRSVCNKEQEEEWAVVREMEMRVKSGRGGGKY